MADQLTGKASIQAGTYIGGVLQQTPSQKAAAGPQAESTTVRMDALRDGSFGGQYYNTGDSFDAPQDQVETLTLSGFAARSDRVATAEATRAADAAEPAPATSTAVAPMTTETAKATAPVRSAAQAARTTAKGGKR